jgi:hypothetical protein
MMTYSLRPEPVGCENYPLQPAALRHFASSYDLFIRKSPQGCLLSYDRIYKFFESLQILLAFQR